MTLLTRKVDYAILVLLHLHEHGEGACAREIAERFDPTFDDNSDPGALLQLLFGWRELAFVNYLRLRNAPTAEARAIVAAEIEGFAAAVAAGIVQQTAYPPGADSSSRDAFCAGKRK